jgi:hypothetical protein
MKRLIAVLCVVAFVVALPLSHVAAAGKGKGPAPKVDICHATDAFDVPQNEFTVIVGHVITVSENAVDAHLAHGDSLVINDIEDDSGIFGLTWRQVAENVGLSTAGANCGALIVDLE